MNIEEIIKSSLENSEMPFDPKAWEAMSSRLDQAMPVAKTSKKPFKWIGIAAAVAVVGITTLILVNDDGEVAAKKQITEQKQIEPNAELREKNQLPKVIADGTVIENAVDTEENVETAKLKQFSQTNVDGKKADKGIKTIDETDGVISRPVDYGEGNPSGRGKTQNDKPLNFVMPTLNAKYCEGESISIKNVNDFKINLVVNQVAILEIPAKKSVSVELAEVGKYSFFYDQVFVNAFKVNAKPKADFFANEETLYDNGLPVNLLKSTYPAQDYNWINAKGEVLSKKAEADIHLFTKNTHEITLKVSSENGCTNQVTKNVRCESNYNLLAMSGFNPESTSMKNRTFIPYALLERNVPFEMEIIDPKNGMVIYKTNSIDEPWDGINKITNSMIPEGATFVWRVKLDKKELGEPKNVYQGTITRM